MVLNGVAIEGNRGVDNKSSMINLQVQKILVHLITHIIIINSTLEDWWGFMDDSYYHPINICVIQRPQSHNSMTHYHHQLYKHRTIVIELSVWGQL